MMKYLYILLALTAAALIYFGGKTIYNEAYQNGYQDGRRDGLDLLSQLYKPEYPNVTIPGKPDTTKTQTSKKGSGKVKPKVPDNLQGNLQVNQPVQVDSIIFGDEGEIIRLLSNDVKKDGIEVNWTFPCNQLEITRTDTVRVMVPVEVVKLEEQPWYNTVWAGIGYGAGLVLAVLLVAE